MYVYKKIVVNDVKVKVQVFYSLISSLKTYHRTFGASNLSYTLPSLSYQIAYSFSTESSEAFEGEVACPRTHHLNNVPIFRREKHYDISLNILQQAGFETTRQAATSAERHALTIVPCPSLMCADSQSIFNQLF